jgi:hypothetical protein
MSPEPLTSPAAVRMATLHDAIDQLEEALRGTNETKILAKINVAAAALYDVWSLRGLAMTPRDGALWAWCSREVS